ncbi:DUF3631 domain-containing protein [Streptomyces sp. 769]|uniref:DUF3631 domain-containing protein n=1 Tax=Streptomyces sp. 769 TaxID=1262452 RepID=UPI00057F2D45|nr:DUF3631 domain-containing protein [Streptomyces sp. 769]AJC55044.1 hypothetical protein GZL_02453 [Streptomyces sp. 769]
MTHLNFILDRVSAALSIEPPGANPHHQLILDVAWSCWEMDDELDELIGDYSEGVSAIEKPERFASLLVERLKYEAELNQLLSMPCCSPAAGEDGPPGPAEDAEAGCCASQPQTIVHYCLDAFAAAGDPDVMSAADLSRALRSRPDVADAGWPDNYLSPVHLAQMLGGYDVRLCDATGHDGRPSKGYRRSDLVAALPDCSC